MGLPDCKRWEHAVYGDKSCDGKMGRSRAAERHGAADVPWFRALGPTARKKQDAPWFNAPMMRCRVRLSGLLFCRIFSFFSNQLFAGSLLSVVSRRREEEGGEKGGKNRGEKWKPKGAERRKE